MDSCILTYSYQICKNKQLFVSLLVVFFFFFFVIVIFEPHVPMSSSYHTFDRAPALRQTQALCWWSLWPEADLNKQYYVGTKRK